MTKNLQVDRKLGRGLSALIGESKSKKELKPANNANLKIVENIEISKIKAGVYQPRQSFEQIELEELAESIKSNGIIQPIILRKIGSQDQYEIIAGERRFRASQIAGLNEISAIVKKINNHEALELALIENIQREDLSPVDEAEGYRRLINEFSYSQEQISKKVGKSRSHIANLLRLLSLPKSVHQLINNNKISMGHARAIINSQNPERLAQQIVNESLNVREIEDRVRDEKVEDIKFAQDYLEDDGTSEIKEPSIRSQDLIAFEEKLSALLDMNTKISYNALKNNGKLTIKFNDFAKINQLIQTLEQCE